MAKSSSPIRAVLFLLLAVLTGVASLVVLYFLIGSYQEKIDEAKQPEDTVMVIVAARDLYQGVTITEEDLYAVEIPPRFLPDSVFLSPEHVVGRIPRERILANEFVRSDRLSDPESGIGLNAVIPRGMRAMSINVTGSSGMQGFLDPLNYVDILVTVTNPISNVTETRTLMQAKFVLGVNSRMQKESREEARSRRRTSPSVTLLVSAEEAEQLAHAERLGSLRLSLRNDLDVDFAENTGGVDLDALRTQLQIKEKTVQRRTRVPKPAPTQTIKIIKGSNVSEKKAEADGTIRR